MESLKYWDMLMKGKLEEKVFVIPWGLGQREKGDHSRIPGTELGMRLGGRSQSQEQYEIYGSVFLAFLLPWKAQGLG